MRLPRDVSGIRCAKALRRLGFIPDRQKGSHLTLHNPTTRRTVVVPMHPALRTGMLAAILEDAGVSVDGFVEAL